MPGLIGVVQAAETIKVITEAGEVLAGRLLLVDGLRMRFRTIEMARDPECRACGTHEITTLIDYKAFCGVPPANSADIPETDDETTPRTLAESMRVGATPSLLDVREPYEWTPVLITHVRTVR